jgi:putative peptidoglycan lipid II flippase
MSKTKLAKNIGSMSVAVFISRIFGLGRDILITGFFGTTYVADAFQVGYQIPNLLRKLFGEGALSAAFVPLYNEIGIKRGKKQQIKFALNVLSLLLLLLLILCLIGILLAPLIVKILAPGFDETTHELTVRLARVMFPYLLLIGLSSTMIAILNSHDYFFIPGLSSALLNVAIIGGFGFIALFYERSALENNVMIIAICVVIGGFLQVIINMPLLRKIGYSIRLIFRVESEAIKAVWRRFIPGVIGLAIRQINLAVDIILASLLVTGSIAALNYGNRLMQLPLGIIGISASVAVLPMFSQYISKQKWQQLQDSLRFSIITLCYIMIPITALIAGLGRDLIRILFLRGAFDLNSLDMTYRALLFYSVGLVFYSISRLLIPLFYANKDTKTPVKISAVIVVVNVVLNIILMRFMAHAGLALATSLSALAHVIILFLLLKKHIPQIRFPKIKKTVAKILLLSILIYGLLIIANHLYLADTFVKALVKVILAGLISFIVYMGGTQLLQIEYSSQIKRKLWKKLSKK